MIRYYIILLGVLTACHSHRSTNIHNHTSELSHSHALEDIPNHQEDYFKSYTLKDIVFGTNTIVTVEGGIRTMKTNALPNHKTGEYPRKGNPNTISAQNKTYTFPVTPKYTGIPKWVREPGVALNGVKFEPGTAEVVVCDTGENYRVEAFQDLINLGLDFNHAHVQPTGAYHYHGSPTSVIEKFDSGKDLVHIGFAQDGFPIYFSKSGAYKSSYKLIDGMREGEDCTYETRRDIRDISLADNHDGTYTTDFEFVEGIGDLDECNGISINGEYMYLVTNEFPYVSRCLMGEYNESQRRGGRQEGRPNALQILERMDANNDGKLSTNELRGPLSSRFADLDENNDGYISREELEKKANYRSSRN